MRERFFFGFQPAILRLLQQMSSPISKLLSRKDKDGLQMVYADDNGNKTDTVRIFIPAKRMHQLPPVKQQKMIILIFQQINPRIIHLLDTSQLTITPTIIKPGDEKSGFCFKKRYHFDSR